MGKNFKYVSLTGLNPEGLGSHILKQMPTVVHRTYLKISEEEEQGRVVMLLGKAINNKQQRCRNCSSFILCRYLEAKSSINLER